MSEEDKSTHRYENDSLSSTDGDDDDDSLSESSPGEPDYEQSYTQELSKANLLLRKTNVLSKPIKSVEELQKCASSMFVAVIESMLNRRIKNIVRVPKRRFDYVRNAQSVIDVLSVVLQSKLQVSAQQISEGHLPSICNLVSVFSRTIELIASKRLKIPESLLDASLFVSSRQSGRAGVRNLFFFGPRNILLYIYTLEPHRSQREERRRLPEDEEVVNEQSSSFQCTEKV